MDPQTTTDTPTTDDRAGFWMRAGAYMIDGFIASLAGVVAILLLASVGLEGTARVAPMLITACYFTVLPALMAGQTPGKKLAGLEIVRRDGEPVGYGTGFLRWVGYMLSVVTVCLGFLMALFTAEGRALEDYVAGTRVIKRQEVSTLRKVVVVGAGLTLPLASVLGVIAAIAIPNIDKQLQVAAAPGAPVSAAPAPAAPAPAAPSSPTR